MTPDDAGPSDLRTERLVLRLPLETDLEALSSLNEDPRVMEHFPAPLTRDESAAMLDRMREHWATHGFGSWVVTPADTPSSFLGLCGLGVPRAGLPFSPCVEVLWRFRSEAWGHGYATEAASAAARDGFTRVGLDEIVSFTVPANRPSLRVMERIGMRACPDEAFEHPALPAGHPLRRHLLYRLRVDDLRA